MANNGGVYTWSRTAGTNASADSTVNWVEGQAPSTLNDSGRAMMASTAKWRDDIAGAITTGGSSTAYTVTSYQIFDSLSDMNGQVIGFTPHTTNGATVTLNVDSLGAKPLRTSPSVELQSGVLIQGTPYVAVYNNSDGAFYLRGVGPQPGIPLGASVDYWGTSAPSTFFALAFGQAISRTTYATLFSLFSTTYGTGDGSTTFNLPDLRGAIVAGKDDMGGSAANKITNAVSGIPGTTLGASGGAQSVTLAANQIPAGVPSTVSGVTVNAGGASIVTTSAVPGNLTVSTGSGNVVPDVATGFLFSYPTTLSQTGTGTAASTNASQAVVNKMPPTIIANKLLRII